MISKGVSLLWLGAPRFRPGTSGPEYFSESIREYCVTFSSRESRGEDATREYRARSSLLWKQSARYLLLVGLQTK